MRLTGGDNDPEIAELVIPLITPHGEIVSLQFITPSGEKKFLEGGRTGGTFYPVCPADPGAAIIYVCEGWATGATIHKALEQPVYATLSAHNLGAVACWLRRKHPDAEIVIAGDDDWKTKNKTGFNPGVAAALKAAQAARAKVAFPAWGPYGPGERDSDFNDLWKLNGSLNEVRQQLRSPASVTPDLFAQWEVEEERESRGEEEPEPEESEEEDGEPEPAAKPAAAKPGKKAEGQADRILSLASEAQLFHAADGSAFADVTINNHRATLEIGRRQFREWLQLRFFRAEEKPANDTSLKVAIDTLAAMARFEAPEREVHVRVANLNDQTIYIDLGNPEWEAVEIDKDGWRIADAPPVRFRRSSGMLALPHPMEGGEIDELLELFNVKDDARFLLLVSWLLAALHGGGPFPVLVLQGEFGSSKSMLARMLKDLVDPHVSFERSPPREERDLHISAKNSYLLSYGNLSHLPGWLSDALCRLATGSGATTRQLYTDVDEVVFTARRPIILNGIGNPVAQPDLADRSIFITLHPIPENERKAESKLMSEFVESRPYILGALLDIVSHGLAQLPHTHPKRLKRMADFQRWAMACETACWKAGEFARFYDLNINATVADGIDDDLVASALRRFVEGLGTGVKKWEGTSGELLDALNSTQDEAVRKAKTWPKSSRGMAGRVRAVAPMLRKVGIDIRYYEHKARNSATLYVIQVSR